MEPIALRLGHAIEPVAIEEQLARLRVVDDRGEPVSKVRFTLELSESSVRTFTAREVEPGLYEKELDVGERRLSASCGNLRSPTVTVTIEEGKTVECTLRLRRRP